MPELAAIWLTLQLSLVTTLALLLIGLPFAWWLSNQTGSLRTTLETLTSLPLVMPPTVIGFYLLIMMSPDTFIGGLWLDLTGDTLTFSFAGLVVASIIYSLPFMIQPLLNAFESVDPKLREAAGDLGASTAEIFRYLILPLSKRGIITGGILTFAHTVGEFGIVLMVGGNIPGETRVISIALYEKVEILNYAEAHILSVTLLTFSFLVLFITYSLNKMPLMRLR